MIDPLLGPPSAALERLLSDEGMEFAPFSEVLSGIDWDIASSRPAGSVHSIADVLGHMRFWQRWLLGLIADGAPRPVSHAADSWPPVQESEWPALVESYLGGLGELRKIAGSEELLERRVQEDSENTVGYQIMSHFAHEAHHLGQIILLRRQLGAWPPPGGGDTW